METCFTMDGAPMKSIIFLALCLVLLSCNNANNSGCNTTDTKETKEESATTAGCEAPSPDPSPIDTDPIVDGDIPDEAFKFNTELEFFNFEVEQEEKVHRAVDIIKTVIASDEFRSKVLNFTYNGRRQFNNNNGLSNKQIYQKLLDGSEKLTPGKDNEMDLELELYFAENNTVGYTYPSSVRVWMNTKYFDPYTPSQVAGNLFHEWTHKLGFDHATTYTVDRDSSVPYAIGYLIRDLGKKYE